jgi:co-chaperonin GroES (HSP10)
MTNVEPTTKEMTSLMPKPEAARLSGFATLGKLGAPAAPAPNSDLNSDTEMVILPDPVGHYMLVALPTMAEQTKGGVIIPHMVNERERAATVVGTVLAQGPDAYRDKARFPAGAWCKTGDTVLFSRYSGMRFKAKDAESGDMVEYRMLTDDNIVGTVPAGAEVGAL